MREEFMAHQFVGLDGGVDVISVDANRHSHQHMLGSFHYFPIDSEQVAPLKCFEAEVVVVEVPGEVENFVKFLVVFLNYVVDCLVEERSWPVAFVFAGEELLGYVFY